MKSIFHGRYSWDGTKKDGREPISWFPGAYDVRITNLAKATESISYIRPYLCVFTNTGKGYSVSSNPEKFAQRICEDFSLQIDKVLWVEQVEPDSENFEIVTFKKRGQLGERSFYAIKKRKPMVHELRLIQKELHVNPLNMNKQITQLQKTLHQLEKKIKETKKRLPAHSAKPQIMMELFDLEDEYHEISQKLDALKRDNRNEESSSV